ncbi:MAG: hypothetical protein IIA73_07890 [Proteobacteria bacterium]|nr:hypothetical protein [Pseudomonadota bacterium]
MNKIILMAVMAFCFLGLAGWFAAYRFVERKIREKIVARFSVGDPEKASRLIYTLGGCVLIYLSYSSFQNLYTHLKLAAIAANLAGS